VHIIVRTALLAVVVLSTLLPFAWSEDSPASTVDRVGFPKGYQESWQKLRVAEAKDGGSVRVVYGNPAAAAKANGAYPYGAIIVMESWSTVKDAQNKAVVDETGHFRRDKVTGLHVMRKERGFGEAYRQNRTGEWEYVEYKPDGTYITPAAGSGQCAACHVKAGAARDWVYGGQP
jgi:Cytochrome P460